ncbi:MAG: DUF5317 family protein [Armatimonadota bacterium]|nr:DUF5317 domain-containing protein [bacterium]
MVPELILIAMLIGWISGGRLQRLGDARIRHWWLILVPVAVYAAGWIFYAYPSLGSLSRLAGPMHLAEKIALFVFVLANIRIPGARLVLVGMALNLLALSANGGIMPASPSAVAEVFGKGAVPPLRSIIMDASSGFKFLCDIVPARRPFVLIPAVYSVGDLVMSLGIFIAIIGLMRTPSKTA